MHNNILKHKKNISNNLFLCVSPQYRVLIFQKLPCCTLSIPVSMSVLPR